MAAILIFSAAVSAHAEDSRLTAIDIHNSPSEYQMSVRALPQAGLLVPDGAPLLKAREIVTTGSSQISAKIKSGLNPDGTALNLGHFDSEVVLKPFKQGFYEVRVSITLRMPDGGTKSLRMSTTVGSGDFAFDPVFVRNFRDRFSSLVRGQFFALEAQYGGDFAQALVEFSSRYVEKTLRELPAVIKAMIDKDAAEDRAKQSAAVSAPSARKARGSSKTAMTVRQEDYRRDEELNIVSESEEGREFPVPERIQGTSFGLSDIDAAGRRVPLAKIEYYVATAALPSGKFRTIFTLLIAYKDAPKSSQTQVFIHEPSVVESDFFPRWKADFLQRAVDKFTAAAQNEDERVERAVFVSYLEPYLYEEYYDFSPFLIKAKMSFQHPSTRKRIEKIMKQKSRPAAPPKEKVEKAPDPNTDDSPYAELSMPGQ
jgi:hypothetical protein